MSKLYLEAVRSLPTGWISDKTKISEVDLSRWVNGLGAGIVATLPGRDPIYFTRADGWQSTRKLWNQPVKKSTFFHRLKEKFRRRLS